MPRFAVTGIRDEPPATIYWLEVEAGSSAEAATALGDRIRGNRLAGMTVQGTHIPVPEGAEAGLSTITIRRLSRD